MAEVVGNHDFLAALFDNKQFSDFVVICAGGEEIRVHKSVLASCSGFFHSLLSSDNGNSTESQEAAIMQWGFHDPAHVLPAVLKFFYTQRLVVSVSFQVSTSTTIHTLLQTRKQTHTLLKAVALF